MGDYRFKPIIPDSGGWGRRTEVQSQSGLHNETLPQKILYFIAERGRKEQSYVNTPQRSFENQTPYET
jgi:hypothetical protein